jgi:hypothetical protein
MMTATKNTASTRGRRLRRAGALVVAAGALVGGLTGCSTTQPSTTPPTVAADIGATPGHPYVIIGAGRSANGESSFQEVFKIPVPHPSSGAANSLFRPVTVTWAAPASSSGPDYKAAVWQADSDSSCDVGYEGPDAERSINTESLLQKSGFSSSSWDHDFICEELLAYGTPSTIKSVPAVLKSADGRVVIKTRLYIDE